MENLKNITTKYIVYIHHNLTNHKVYIGITCQSPEKRWQNGKHYKSNAHFYSAICKYGWNGFEHIIYAQNISAESAYYIEQDLIQLYNSNDPKHGYNISLGGEHGGLIDGFGEIRRYCKERLQKIKNIISEKEYNDLIKLFYDNPPLLKEILQKDYKIKKCKSCKQIFHFEINTQSYCSECNTEEEKKKRANNSKKEWKLKEKQDRRFKLFRCNFAQSD